ncbi:hypothetical protein [Pararhizobium gei]|uniref:hypothetical protein n=1 Tax=Pararhizobium gei TaxID=1395951 RepID=UPI0023DCD6CE|nr:hypothetical protein [Rhizobium gei]
MTAPTRLVPRYPADDTVFAAQNHAGVATISAPFDDDVALADAAAGDVLDALDAEMNKNYFSAEDPELDAAVAGALAAEHDMKLQAAIDDAEEVRDLLHALDKIGDGIGGADGYAVSAVAIAARSVADNLVHGLKVLGLRIERV